MPIPPIYATFPTMIDHQRRLFPYSPRSHLDLKTKSNLPALGWQLVPAKPRPDIPINADDLFPDQQGNPNFLNLAAAPEGVPASVRNEYFSSPYKPHPDRFTNLMEQILNVVGGQIMRDRLNVGYFLKICRQYLRFNVYAPHITAIAPTTETLICAYLPQLLHRLKPGKILLVNNLGYPVIGWHLDIFKNPVHELQPQSPNPKLTCALTDVIKHQVKLPTAVGYIYIDYPSTLFGTQFSVQELESFMRRNPQIVFIIDQANVHLSPTKNLQNDVGLQLRNNTTAKFLILHTTTKNLGCSGCAWTYASSALLNQLENPRAPDLIGLDETTLATAEKAVGMLDRAAWQMGEEDNLFWASDVTPAARYWQEVTTNRTQIVDCLRQKLGPQLECVVNKTMDGPHLILDATTLGLTGNQLHQHFLDHHIGTKTGVYYGDATTYPELANYLYLGIPFTSSHCQQVLHALEDLPPTPHLRTP